MAYLLFLLLKSWRCRGPPIGAAAMRRLGGTGRRGAVILWGGLSDHASVKTATYGEALDCYRLAADPGYPAAQISLGATLCLIG